MATSPDVGIAERIDKTIEDRRMSYSEVSRRVGMSPATVWNWAKAKTTISLDKLVELAEILDVSPEYLAFGTVPAEPQPARESSSLRWKYNPDFVEIVEFMFEESPFGAPVQKWRMPRKFVEDTLNLDERYSFLFEVKQEVKPYLSRGDVVMVDRRGTSPVLDGDGYYLIFRPFFPSISYVEVKARNNDAKYILREPSGAEENERDLQDVRILGKVVGSVQRLHIPPPNT
jgi:transcriptional regulator with XRE-family HTH domain